MVALGEIFVLGLEASASRRVRSAAAALVLGMDQIMMNVRLLPWPDEKIFLNSYRRVASVSVIPKTQSYRVLTCREYRQNSLISGYLQRSTRAPNFSYAHVPCGARA